MSEHVEKKMDHLYLQQMMTETTSNLAVVILAAGQGTRMCSALPKVLHTLAGKPLLEHVVCYAESLDPGSIHVVYGHGGEQVRERLSHLQVNWVLQEQQLGTGHAVEQALPQIGTDQTVLVLYGDVPLVKSETLLNLLNRSRESGFSLLTVSLESPAGYGRIVRSSDGRMARIVEQRDASVDELEIREVNTGILAVSGDKLKGWIDELENGNAQGEFYLTDIVEMAVRDGVEIKTVSAATAKEVQGVNDRLQLSQLERAYQRDQAEQLMLDGVTLLDPDRFDLRGTAKAGQDVIIDVNVILQGEVILGDRVEIGANCHIQDATIEEGTVILPNSVIDSAEIGPSCRIGPFARIRPGTKLTASAHVGNFVELKNSQVAEGSKINHLSYVGDSIVGARVNIGAGVITCNYDGANKYRTVIGDDAFVGSDTQLVAPVEVGRGATIGAGSTIVKDAPADQLTLSRSKQTTIKGWRRPQKKS